MFHFFKNRNENENEEETNNGIRILKQRQPEVCGGTDASIDERAPKTIVSDRMTVFSAFSVIHSATAYGEEAISYFSAFAAPTGGGTFLFLETSPGIRRRDERKREWALVKEDVMPRLVLLVREKDLARENGYHSTTHGLPENFGGSVRILYESGERIDFSNNQSPILTTEQGEAIVALFREAMRGERAPLPDLSQLVGIGFSETHSTGGYTRAELTLREDGTGVNKKTAKYDSPTVYESEKEVSAETVSAVKSTIEKCGLLAWAGLPDSPYQYGGEREMVFRFADGGETVVSKDKELPCELSGGFFDVQLELTTRH